MLRKLIAPFKRTKEPVSETPDWSTFRSASTDRALERIVKRGMRIMTVVDVGASNGSWSEVCLKHLPDSEYLLIEAQSCHTKELDEFCGKHSRARYILSAAGNEDGYCFFDDADPFGGLASNQETGG